MTHGYKEDIIPIPSTTNLYKVVWVDTSRRGWIMCSQRSKMFIASGGLRF